MARRSELPLLSVILALSVLLFAGCQAATPTLAPTTAPTSEPTPTPAPLTEIPLPITNTPITLSIWCAIQDADLQYFTNLAETPAAQEIMERTGLTLKFQHPPVGQENEQFNIMLSSGDLPDIIHGYFSTYTGGVEQAFQDGLIIDVKDLVEMYAPNFKRILLGDEFARPMLYNDNGFLTGFGSIISFDQPYGDGYPFGGPMIRQDFLTKLELEMPYTIDEWHDVLTAFKDNKDLLGIDVPYAWSDKDYDLMGFSGMIANAFDLTWWGFINDMGVVKYSPIEPKYRDFLAVLKQWYAEGLLDQDFATHNYMDHTQPMMQTGKAAAGSMHLYWWAAIKDSMDEGASLVPAPLPVLTKDQKLRFIDEYGWALDTFNAKFITKACQYPKEAVMLIDWMYTDEAKLLTNWGIEGESYVMVDGKPAFSEKYKADPQKIGSIYFPNRLKQTIDSAQNLAQYPHKTQADAWALWKGQTTNDMDQRLRLPPGIVFSAAEQEENSQIMTEVETYQKEMFLKFVMGVEPLDKFDEYVAQIKSMNIQTVIDNYQAALDKLLSK